MPWPAGRVRRAGPSLATAFAHAASTAGVGRIVYLGGLGHEDLSTHLSSRQEVGTVLGSTGVPVVELRAAVVLGAGSISFEMVRYLTERLPMMICPRWVNTPMQPIALCDLLDYLVQATPVAPGVYEIGCTDATTYRQMMDTYARVRGLRPRLVVKVPVLTPALSAHWVDLVTPVDATISHALIESLTNEVTVRTRDRTDAAFSVRPLTVAAAIRAALDSQADQITATLFARRHGLDEGVYTDRSRARLRRGDIGPDGTVPGFAEDLADCGGRLSWYGLPFAWLLRITLGHLFGEDLRLGRPDHMAPGERGRLVDHRGQRRRDTGPPLLRVVLRRGLARRSGWRPTGRRPSSRSGRSAPRVCSAWPTGGCSGRSTSSPSGPWSGTGGRGSRQRARPRTRRRPVLRASGRPGDPATR